MAQDEAWDADAHCAVVDCPGAPIWPVPSPDRSSKDFVWLCDAHAPLFDSAYWPSPTYRYELLRLYGRKRDYRQRIQAMRVGSA